MILFEVRLIDGRRKELVSVALPDVGYGISQILPFLVQSLVPRNQLFPLNSLKFMCIRRLQADLGDLLVEAIKRTTSKAIYY